MTRFNWILAAVVVLAWAGPAFTADKADSSDQEEAIKKQEDAWVAAAKKKDANAFAAVFADDYAITAAMGAVLPKDDVVNALREGTLEVQSGEFSDWRIRIYGDAAVATGKLELNAKWSGDDISGDYRFTDTFVKRDGKWLMVASQMTALK